MKQLTLYSRTGCCLCEGLESRLRDLDLKGLSIELTVIDIDAPGTPQELKARYDLEVPVLALDGSELPRVCLLYTSPSPRDVEESRMPSSA